MSLFSPQVPLSPRPLDEVKTLCPFPIRHSTHVTLGYLLPQFPHQRNGGTPGGLGGVEIVLLSFSVFTKMGLLDQQSCPSPKKLNLLPRIHSPPVFPGGEMVQAEPAGVTIVRSPSNITFTTTRQYL